MKISLYLKPQLCFIKKLCKSSRLVSRIAFWGFWWCLTDHEWKRLCLPLYQFWAPGLCHPSWLLLDMVAHACHPRTWEAEGLGIQGNPHLHDIPRVNLSFMGTCAKNKTKGKSKTASLACPCSHWALSVGLWATIFLRSFLSCISPVFVFYFCKPLYYLCAHYGGQRRTLRSVSLSPRWDWTWLVRELWAVVLCLHYGTRDWTRLVRLAIFPAEPSHQPHFPPFFNFYFYMPDFSRYLYTKLLTPYYIYYK